MIAPAILRFHRATTSSLGAEITPLSLHYGSDRSFDLMPTEMLQDGAPSSFFPWTPYFSRLPSPPRPRDPRVCRPPAPYDDRAGPHRHRRDEPPRRVEPAPDRPRKSGDHDPTDRRFGRRHAFQRGVLR